MPYSSKCLAYRWVALLQAWVEYQLSSLLGFDGVEEMATYLLQMPAGNKSEEFDLRQYAKELLGEGQV